MDRFPATVRFLKGVFLVAPPLFLLSIFLFHSRSGRSGSEIRVDRVSDHPGNERGFPLHRGGMKEVLEEETPGLELEVSKVSGIVRDGEGNPLEGVNLFLFIEGSSRKLLEEATSSPDGTFSLSTEYTPGQQILAHLDGYRKGVVIPASRGTVQIVLASTHLTGSIKGVVVDAQGMPIKQFSVHPVCKAWDEVGASYLESGSIRQYSNPDGNFEYPISVLDRDGGEFYVTIIAEGYNSCSSDILKVTQDHFQKEIRIILEKDLSPSLSGTVFGENGVVLMKAKV
ncbi:MAG: carboxypeptidase-like regulatory domain-containing protein, partial [Planctomycetota bacterium]|nr:carboxypeptidase-like regulatory domain-containing protein [Planctomycetota bacterium]